MKVQDFSLNKLRAKRQVNREKAIADMQYRDKRSRVVQILTSGIPRAKNMKLWQDSIDVCADEIMEALK